MLQSGFEPPTLATGMADRDGGSKPMEHRQALRPPRPAAIDWTHRR